MIEKNLIKLVLFHISIGALIAFCPFFSKVYAILIILIGFWVVIKSKNKNDEVLYVIAYIVGSEVFLRTTFGNPCHEYGKYFMLSFTLLGFFYKGIPKFRNPYWFYLTLILPAIFISTLTLTEGLRIKILYEILGPICLGVLALYTYKREISLNRINAILNVIALPIVTTCVFLIIKYSEKTETLSSYGSNFYFSGNFGPNQMATALGLGLFIYFLKIQLETYSKKILYINLIIFCVIYYRGLLTFSRGGIITSLIVIFSIILTMYIGLKKDQIQNTRIAVSLFLLPLIFMITSYYTENKLSERYSIPTEVSIKKGGRYLQVKTDINRFKENPIFGVGVGVAKRQRSEIESKRVINTHVESTRMLSEHGILGMLSLIILIFYPLKLYRNNLQNIYVIPFLIFWFLTINHSATRIAAPSFIYALALLQIKSKEK